MDLLISECVKKLKGLRVRPTLIVAIVCLVVLQNCFSLYEGPTNVQPFLLIIFQS